MAESDSPQPGTGELLAGKTLWPISISSRFSKPKEQRQYCGHSGAPLFRTNLLPQPSFQGHIDRLVTDTAIVFAIHARRILDINAIRTQFILNEPFRHWAASRLPRATGFREALNRIVHATEFEVGFERLPEGAANIQGGAIGVVYLRTKTDKREEALIDVFSLASCFFHQVLPVLRLPHSSSLPETTH